MSAQLNLIGRTQVEQERIEADLITRGSLWPRFDILHRFAFTQRELDEADNARRILTAHRAKVRRVAGRYCRPQ